MDLRGELAVEREGRRVWQSQARWGRIAPAAVLPQLVKGQSSLVPVLESHITPSLVGAVHIKKCTSDCQPETSFDPISHLHSFECSDTEEQQKYGEVGAQPYLPHFRLHSIIFTTPQLNSKSIDAFERATIVPSYKLTE